MPTGVHRSPTESLGKLGFLLSERTVHALFRELGLASMQPRMARISSQKSPRDHKQRTVSTLARIDKRLRVHCAGRPSHVVNLADQPHNLRGTLRLQRIHRGREEADARRRSCVGTADYGAGNGRRLPTVGPKRPTVAGHTTDRDTDCVESANILRKPDRRAPAHHGQPSEIGHGRALYDSGSGRQSVGEGVGRHIRLEHVRGIPAEAISVLRPHRRVATTNFPLACRVRSRCRIRYSAQATSVKIIVKPCAGNRTHG